ncbi:MAG: MFS transporter [Chloroflexota bacterium]|nr:MFS transporter [Chloroflexota bacterium]
MSDALSDPSPKGPSQDKPKTIEPTSTQSRSIRAGEVPIDGPGDNPLTDLSELGGLFSPGRRALTVGLVMTITLVAFEALAVSTVMPLVARELGGLELYGWVFSAFFLGTLIGIVVVGGLIDRGSLVRPLAAGLALFTIGLIIGGLASSMPILVAGRFLSDVLGTALGTGVGGALLAFSARSGLETWVGLAGAFAAGAAVGLLGIALARRLTGRRDAAATSGNGTRLG